MAVKSRRRSARAPRRSDKDAPRQRERLKALQQSVETVAKRLHRDGLLQSGAIVFRAAADDSAAFALRANEYGVQIEYSSYHADAVLEVIGDPRRIDAIVRGRKDARMQFFAGGIRVRGDMYYLSRLGMELGFLKKPII